MHSDSPASTTQDKEAARTSVLIADDHALVRVGIQTLLRQLSRFEVVGEATDGNDALGAIQRLQPDVVLMDVAMPGLSGIEVAERLRTQGCASRVVMLSANEDRETVLASLKAGSRGYLVKDLLLAELEIALEAIRRGNSYISPRVAHYLIESANTEPQQAAKEAQAAPSPVDCLTSRQRDVLAAVARGLSTKEIARELGISPKTVEFHRADICDRLGVRDIAGLVRIALKAGLVVDQ